MVLKSTKTRIEALVNNIKDNRGDTNIQKLFLILIAFVAGTALIAIIYYALETYYGAGTSGLIDDILG